MPVYTPTLNQEKRRERRFAVAEAIQSGKSVAEAAIEYGCSEAWVSNACAEFGVKLQRGRPPGQLWHNGPRIVSVEEWTNADWSLRDTDLATKLGVTRERVRQIRQKLNKPQSVIHKCPSSSARLRQWIIDNRELVENSRASDIRALIPFRTSLSAIDNWLRKLGIAQIEFAPVTERITKENFRSLAQEMPSGCWEWPGCTRGPGYARIGTDYGHHFSFRLFKGKIPNGLWVLHTCDNKRCVNPDHLYAGTAKDNAQDRMIRGRDNHCLLTPDQVREVRRLRTISNWSIARLAEKFSVHVHTIYGIIRGKTYAHITDAA